MVVRTIRGWAHLCFQCIDESGRYCVIRGHIVNEASTESFGIVGHCMDYEDPNRNDCMDPEHFYQITVKDYQDSSHSSLVVRRPADDDAAGLATHENDKEFNEDQTCTFVTERFLTGEKAVQHCKQYLTATTTEDLDSVVCLGSIILTLKKEQ